jgi:hypothetical protein
MKKALATAAVLLALAPSAAAAKPAVGLTASPNPAPVGQRVSYTIDLAVGGSLQAWVSAQGFAQPKMGSLPPGTWTWECCPSQTAGTPAWHYRSSVTAPPGKYRFGAQARLPGMFLSTAEVGSASVGVWVQVL